MAPIDTNPRHLEWLRVELAQWRRDGLVSEEAADAILGRYVAHRRFGLVTAISALGALFVLVGFVWLVISNLDRLGPLGRVLLVGGLWVAAAAATEWMAARAMARGDTHSPLVGALRLLVAGAVGGVVYLAGDLLGRIDDDAMWWIGVWAVTVLLYGYARDAVAAVLLGALLLFAWYAAQTASSADSLFAFTGAALVAGVVAAALAALHPARWAARHGFVWSCVSAAATVIGMFAAGVPFERGLQRGWPTLLLVGLSVATLLAVVELVRRRAHRPEIAVALGALLFGGALSLWQGDDTFSDGAVEPTAWVRAGVSVVLFLVVAGAVLALGVRRDTPILTAIATVGLVVFMTFQGFAVFAEILSGAALFLTVGVVLIGTALLVDRARRRLTAEFAPEVPMALVAPVVPVARPGRQGP